jgi:hypothetical protein
MLFYTEQKGVLLLIKKGWKSQLKQPPGAAYPSIENNGKQQSILLIINNKGILAATRPPQGQADSSTAK